MEKLSESNFSPSDDNPADFKTCWICGQRYIDIYELSIHREYDEEDKPTDVYIVACKKCQDVIKEHPRLYYKEPIYGGTPGKLFLLCGDCKNRNKFSCSHPDCSKNGGERILVYGKPLFGTGFVHISLSNGKGGSLPPIFDQCTQFVYRDE